MSCALRWGDVGGPGRAEARPPPLPFPRSRAAGRQTPEADTETRRSSRRPDPRSTWGRGTLISTGWLKIYIDINLKWSDTRVARTAEHTRVKTLQKVTRVFCNSVIKTNRVETILFVVFGGDTWSGGSYRWSLTLGKEVPQLRLLHRRHLSWRKKTNKIKRSCSKSSR